MDPPVPVRDSWRAMPSDDDLRWQRAAAAITRTATTSGIRHHSDIIQNIPKVPANFPFARGACVCVPPASSSPSWSLSSKISYHQGDQHLCFIMMITIFVVILVSRLSSRVRVSCTYPFCARCCSCRDLSKFTEIFLRVLGFYKMLHDPLRIFNVVQNETTAGSNKRMMNKKR